MKRITPLRRVGITAPDPAGLGRFYEQTWGLRTVGEREGAVYLRGAGEEHHALEVPTLDENKLNQYTEVGIW